MRRNRIAFFALLAASLVAATPAAAAERKRVQEVDLKRLEIQGRIEDPASVFVLETGRLLLSDAAALAGLLPGRVVVPVEKGAMEREVVARIESSLGVARR